MKKTAYFLILAITVTLFNTGCNNNNTNNEKVITEANPVTEENEYLIKFLEHSGNFINNKKIPTLISADEVKRNLKKYFIIDLRKHDDYVNGHINGAVNVELDNLISYMKKNVSAGAYDKIITVCYSGQKASFAAMTLQLLGYSNAYAMKWGMSSWDINTAKNKLLKKTSDKYSGKLETKNNPKLPKTNLPEIKTGKNTGYAILETRAKEILKRNKFFVTVDKVMNNPGEYYIINYWPDYNYNKGHLPGAVQYTPKQSLTIDKELLTLPTDKKIAVYDFTGQHAAFVTAYLQILGYDAYSVLYGANAFMHSKLTSLKIGHAFDKSQIKNYPVITGELPSPETAKSNENNTEEDNAPVVPLIKKKPKQEEEGGC